MSGNSNTNQTKVDGFDTSKDHRCFYSIVGCKISSHSQEIINQHQELCDHRNKYIEKKKSASTKITLFQKWLDERGVDWLADKLVQWEQRESENKLVREVG